MSVKNNASITAVIGSSGSGKSASIKQHLKKIKPKRLLIWDPLREYGDHGDIFTSLVKCLDTIEQDKTVKKSFAVVYQPPAASKDKKQMAFDAFCFLAMYAGDVVLVIEELGLVTEPGYAPAGWQEVTLTGRHRGLQVIASSQRPARVDKDFFSNCTRVRCGRLNFDNDVKVMSNVLRVPADQVQELKPLEYIERDMSTGQNKHGKITF